MLKPALCLFTLFASIHATASTPTPKAGPIPNQYIVRLNMDLAKQQLGLVRVDQVAQSLLGTLGVGKVQHIYEHALNGFSVSMTPLQAKLLSALPIVQAIEPDQWVGIAATQANPPYGLDRIDQVSLPLNNTYNYADSAGQGVHVYILDTGLRATHSDFIGRVGTGRNFAPNSSSPLNTSTDPNNTSDCQGHGTHVAGTAVGTQYGVAKKATVHAVRVLGCDGSGSNSGVIAGVDWVVANKQLPAVANMSLGGGASSALDDAVKRATAAGVTFVVAAGNDNTNACNGSPNRVPEAVTVGASTRTDSRASYSNFGTCLDLFAPGDATVSASHNSDNGTATLSGTSMASPHVAGAAALFLSANPTATPAQVSNALVTQATANKITSAGTGSVNKLLNVTSLGGPVSTVPTDPPTTPTEPCTSSGAGKNCTLYTFSASNGSATLAPNSSGFSASGSLNGYLQLPTGMTATITLQRLTRSLFSSSWSNVASSSTGTLKTTNQTSATYRWRISVTAGSGTVKFYGQPN